MEPQIIIAIIFVIIIIVLQFVFFSKTKNEIKRLQHYFPRKKDITVQYNRIKKDILDDDDKLSSFLSGTLPGDIDDATIIARGENPADFVTIPLIKCSSDTNSDFKATTKELNAYLCKNNDVAGADFGIIKDIYESPLKSMQSTIQNSLNTPLLLGLAGTFIGIIIGLGGMIIGKGITDNHSIYSLLGGVALAMFASLIGLALTIRNSSFNYKTAYDKCEADKENYFNILRKQLLPSLSSTMEQGLNSLKGVLGQFVSSFGNQLQGYTSAFQLLNDNIRQEHDLMEEINQLNITKTSLSIARSFGKLKEASDELEVFHQYQQSLNGMVNNVSSTLAQFNGLADKFEDFFNSLNMVVNNQNIASQMQRQFTEAIEQHFPLGSEGREQWRKEYDLLVSDAQQVSAVLQNELQETTRYIENFVESNKNNFERLSELPAMLSALGKYAELQTTCYNDLKTVIATLMAQQKQNLLETAEMNKSILEALRVMVKTIKENK